MLFWVFTVVMIVVVVWGFVVGVVDEETVCLLVCWIICVCLVFFLLAFVVVFVGMLWFGGAVDWLLDNRKYFGFVFVYGVVLNVMIIIWLASFNFGVIWS